MVECSNNLIASSTHQTQLFSFQLFLATKTNWSINFSLTYSHMKMIGENATPFGTTTPEKSKHQDGN